MVHIEFVYVVLSSKFDSSFLVNFSFRFPFLYVQTTITLITTAMDDTISEVVHEKSDINYHFDV